MNDPFPPFIPRFNDPDQGLAFLRGESEEGAIYPFVRIEDGFAANQEWLDAKYEIGFTTIDEKPHGLLRKTGF